MKLVVGLGNPGQRYEGTRHNIGWDVVEAVGLHHQARFLHRSLASHWARIGQGEESLILAKPQTYMNRSGEAVGALTRYFKIPLAHVLIVVDDMNLPLGRLRFRAQGSAGGHNGLKSIIDQLGTDQFARLRIGIGQPANGQDPAEFVLQRFCAEEEPILAGAREHAMEGIEAWADQGITSVMTQFNQGV